MGTTFRTLEDRCRGAVVRSATPAQYGVVVADCAAGCVFRRTV
jgi:hypothetical protein